MHDFSQRTRLQIHFSFRNNTENILRPNDKYSQKRKNGDLRTSAVESEGDTGENTNLTSKLRQSPKGS